MGDDATPKYKAIASADEVTALRDAVKRLTDELRTVTTLLVTYGVKHHYHCQKEDCGLPCRCGLDDALATLDLPPEMRKV
jgi:hypothetical protein